MIPAYIVRVGIDSTRHNPEFNGLNPCTRCEAAIKTVTTLFNEQVGPTDPALIESATADTYFAEFFHSAQPANGETEWRDELIKQSGQHSAFESWEEWFKKKFADLYQDDNIWIALMMTSFAYTHQYELVYTEDAWEFSPASPYLRMEQLRQLAPHIETVTEILHQIWQKEVDAYRASGFDIDESKLPNLGKVECLGFDTKKYDLVWPPATRKAKEELSIGETAADIVLPAADDGYRQLDSAVFAGGHIDVTSLANRANYFFKSRRRLFELSVDDDAESALMRASAEGWMVPDMQTA